MRKLVLGLAVVTVAACALVGGAIADTGKTEAQVVGAVQIDRADPTVGYVLAQYTCQPGAPGSTAAGHLFVSVKQNAARTADPAVATEGAGFGGLVAVWSQSHPTDQVVCDGKNHVQRFTVHQGIDEESGQPTGYGQLAKGYGYVQFCLFGGDGTYTSSQVFARIQ